MVINNRVIPVASKVIALEQSEFINGRFILDGVDLLHEVMHEVNKKRLSVVLFKVEFEKAYNKVNWSFLETTSSLIKQ